MKRIQQQIILYGRADHLVIEEGNLLSKLEERRKQEEIPWKQKSPIQWLREGDKNTNFFHKAMIERRQHNRIFSLKDLGGNRLVQHNDMEALLVIHFSHILT